MHRSFERDGNCPWITLKACESRRICNAEMDGQNASECKVKTVYLNSTKQDLRDLDASCIKIGK